MSEWVLLLVASIPLFVVWIASGLEILFLRPDLAAPKRLGWIGLLVLVPLVGLAFYVLVRPPRGFPSMSDNTGADRARRFVEMAESRRQGEIDDDTFRAEVRSLVADDVA